MQKYEISRDALANVQICLCVRSNRTLKDRLFPYCLRLILFIMYSKITFAEFYLFFHRADKRRRKMSHAPGHVRLLTLM